MCWTQGSKWTHITDHHKETRMWVITLVAKGLESYTVYWAATTETMEVSICLRVTPRRQKAEMVLWDDLVPAFKTCWTAQFLMNSNEVAIILNLCALTFTHLQSSMVADPKVWLITYIIRKQNGASGHPFLPLSHWDKQVRDLRAMLFCSQKLLPESSDEAQQQLVSYHHRRSHLKEGLLTFWAETKWKYTSARASKQRKVRHSDWASPVSQGQAGGGPGPGPGWSSTRSGLTLAGWRPRMSCAGRGRGLGQTIQWRSRAMTPGQIGTKPQKEDKYPEPYLKDTKHWNSAHISSREGTNHFSLLLFLPISPVEPANSHCEMHLEQRSCSVTQWNMQEHDTNESFFFFFFFF